MQSTTTITPEYLFFYRVPSGSFFVRAKVWAKLKKHGPNENCLGQMRTVLAKWGKWRISGHKHSHILHIYKTAYNKEKKIKMSAKKVCAKRLRQMKKSRAKWNFFAHLAHLALGSGSPVLVIPLWTCKKQFCDKIMSVLDMKIVKDIFLKLHTNIKNH